MKITKTRITSQIFFFTLFVWFVVVNTVGEEFWQLRGWPVHFFLYIDPLTAIGTILSTGTLYKNLALALITLILTFILGRFFCSWVCPFGSIHHFFSFIAYRNKTTAQRIKLNRYHKGQRVKYIVLVIFLVTALFPFGAASLQTGLLDPIPLVNRSFNLMLLPILDRITHISSAVDRLYEGAWIIFLIFITAIILNFVIPRFYCRFVCPLGALMGIIGRFALWRIGQNDNKCYECGKCEPACQGGCEPSSEIYSSECILCFNCMKGCPHNTISYQTRRSTAGEIPGSGLSRRGFLLSLGSGALAVPAVRLSGLIGANWHHGIIRPPGALAETEFLKRCIKCGQCMRTCPTNVIQPGGIANGIENLWTPVLNFRAGTSGCQYNCVACGHACPTSAIRPLTLKEKHGKGAFAADGPVTMGTAFVDRNRCLPWAMDTPCIVCEENCPVSPKAIFTDKHFSVVRNGVHTIKNVTGTRTELEGATFKPGKYASGDYYLMINNKKYKITENSQATLITNEKIPPKNTGSTGSVLVRLQRPHVDIEKCIGCGICQHECPVSGLKAIRVSAEGESRSNDRVLRIKV